MSASLARLLSRLLHPSLLTTYFLLTLLMVYPFSFGMITQKGKWIVVGLIFLFTFILPGLSAYLMMKWNKIRSLEMESLEERRIPFLIATIYYLTCYYLLKEIQVPLLLSQLMLGASLVLLITSLISSRWKISIHMAGIGGVCGAFIGCSNYFSKDFSLFFIFWVLLSGLLGTARLSLESHSPSQVYCGFLLGLSCQAILISAL